MFKQENYWQRALLRSGVFGTVIRPPQEKQWQVRYVDVEGRMRFPLIGEATLRIHPEENHWRDLRFPTAEDAIAFLRKEVAAYRFSIAS